MSTLARSLMSSLIPSRVRAVVLAPLEDRFLRRRDCQATGAMKIGALLCLSILLECRHCSLTFVRASRQHFSGSIRFPGQGSSSTLWEIECQPSERHRGCGSDTAVNSKHPVSNRRHHRPRDLRGSMRVLSNPDTSKSAVSKPLLPDVK